MAETILSYEFRTFRYTHPDTNTVHPAGTEKVFLHILKCSTFKRAIFKINTYFEHLNSPDYIADLKLYC